MQHSAFMLHIFDLILNRIFENDATLKTCKVVIKLTKYLSSISPGLLHTMRIFQCSPNNEDLIILVRFLAAGLQPTAAL